jgi:hypothetical protein
MNLLNPKSKTKRKVNNLTFLFLLTTFFLFFILLNSQKFFSKFDKNVVDRYLRSQDIEDIQDKIKDRIFVSDEEIYIASGYLYAGGSKSTEYNFQHPPLVKYMFGFSSKYFGLPLLPNIFFGIVLLFEVYFLGSLVFKNKLIGFIGSVLLLIDPVFKEVTTYALLDLGQMVFILGFIIATLYFQKKLILQGILLGLASASKFYSPLVIFLGIIYLYKIATKQFKFKNELVAVLAAFFTFSLSYVKNWPINIFFEQAKIVKFMLTHNHAVEWGGVVKLFFGGYFLWPILFFVNLYQILKTNYVEREFLIYLLPLIYILIMCFQIPFTRYFILILPTLYLGFSSFLINFLNKNNPRQKIV